MTTEQQALTIEQRIKNVFKKVLDIKPEEIKADANLDVSLGVDSTEMVEISVVIKKELGIALKDNELKKTQSFNEIVAVLKIKTQDGAGGGHSCGCGHNH